MKQVKTPLNAVDVTYGRVTPYVPPHKPRKQSNVIYAVSFFLPDWKPDYAHAGKCLSYQIEQTYYKIFNPQKFVFNLDEFKEFLVQWHWNTDGLVPQNFEVIDS